MRRVRIAVAGAGLIAQVEHIPNLLFLRDRFDLVAVADPSPQGRAMLESRAQATDVDRALAYMGRVQQGV